MQNYYHLLTDEQREIQQMVRQFADERIIPVCKECDITGEFPTELYKEACDLGLTTFTLPEKYGGAGGDIFTYSLIKEELARGDAGFSGTVAGAYMGIVPIKVAGTEYHWKLAADILTQGGAMSFTLTEPNAGSDPAAMRATAVKDGDEYILNGTKTFITNGAVASVFVGFFKTNPAAGHKGISAFIIDADAPGVTVGAHENKMGLRLSNTTDLIFENVRVKASAMVGPEGSGFKLAMNALNLSRAFVATLAVGIMQRALDESVKYAKERKQFNTPIIKFQMVQQMLADMAIKIEASRCLVNNTMKMMDAGIMVQKEGSICKTFVSDCAQEVTSNAVQIFGGYGYSKEYPVEKLMRDVKVFQIFEGANQVQRLTIANVLNKEYK